MGDKEGEALAESPCRYLHKPSTHGMCQHRRQESHLPDSPVIRVTRLVLSLLPSPPRSVSKAAVQFGMMFLVCEPLQRTG